MKTTKIIYINSRAYGREFYDIEDDNFFLFGIGHFLAWQMIKRYPDIIVENWRADAQLLEDKTRVTQGIVCRVFKGKKKRSIGTWSPSLLKELKLQCENKDQYTLVHFHGMHNLGYDLLMWLIPKVPIVITHHGGGNFNFKFEKKRKWLTYLAEKFDLLTMKFRVGHAIIQTETQLNYLSKHMGDDRVSKHAPFGFDFEIFKIRNKPEARNQLGINPNAKVILSIGRADYLKGVERVVSVYKALENEIDNLQLLCLDIQPSDRYYDLIKSSGAIVKGHVDYYELPLYYSASDVLVYLPMDDESLNFAGPGYVNAEALACGIPTVSSLLVHYFDNEIETVARIPKTVDEAIIMTKEMINHPPSPQKCRDVAFEQFNWDHVMDTHLGVYRKLMKIKFGPSAPVM